MTGQITRQGLQVGGGYGFIRSEGQQYFFHCSSLVDLPFDGSLADRTVEFELGQGKKGIAAVNVRAAGGDA